ncbi:MAG: MFS transporter [Bacteroidetes bacterium GWF2_33_16]|nr:MAG: MFS transporter [Bacteroidetes bacterium GWE2_32_14]OFY03458.1 MAG: MFS transporter [Bacteroidetes bacterium GWF2_33_16]
MKDLSAKKLQTITLIIASVASFITPFISSAINVALPTIGKDFNANAIGLSWVATSFLLSSAIFLVPFGRLADIYGRKLIFNAGLIIYSIATLLCAFAPDITLLIIFRIFQGMGGAMIFGTGMAIITSVFPKENRGKALGIVVASVYAGLTMGPFIGGIITKILGWHSLFLLTIPLGLISLVLSFIFLSGDWREAKGEKFDWKGSLIFGIAISSLMYGFGQLPGTSGIILTGAGLLGLYLFIRFESIQLFPVININLFKTNRVFAFSNYAALINYSATFAIGFLLSLYLQYIKGFNPQQAGQILVVQPLLMTIFSPITGKLSDRINPGKVASVGMALLSAGLFILSFINSDTSIYFIIPVLVIFGIGYALFSSPNTNSIMGSVEKKYYGIASATVGTMRLVGQMSSMGVAMLLFSIFIGNVEINSSNSDAFVASIRTAFIIFAFLCFIGIFFSLARNKKNNNNDHSGSSKIS